ncbi:MULTISPECIES: MgtC/SapB family protein [Photobacterium]|uniref:Protein MgtC n=1 Tax=Photobacterium ganghwense TaxID=320778 RepID=A0A0J1K5P8_9GAMM|nr:MULTISPECIES: MgtC/SapB family protein [Photobacterium]KLV09687.1 membrane protein [Photobacterium ganghwense]MBV1841031.1 MgtC/SapB family protein [Photobacterium ganghwense]PSU04760.1 MgtC/SapB family protein [Photobacterium ganghwense]QSV13913.1 MgtC/SapB family protein [Photobacterium ganghwense]
MWPDIDPFTWPAILQCAICGAVIGFERQVRGKPVGIRTSTLIVLGTYCFITLGETLSVNNADISRVLAQVITGIGFLGAGVMMNRDGQVHGVTSAAVIWMLAALGITIGLDYGQTAVIMTGLVVAILLGVDKLENSLRFLRNGVHAHLSDRQQRKKMKRHQAAESDQP